MKSSSRSSHRLSPVAAALLAIAACGVLDHRPAAAAEAAQAAARPNIILIMADDK